MDNKLQNLTILINTCDSYDDLWEPFFKLFKKFGGELAKCPIVLNTESKKFTYEDLNISCPNNFDKTIEWGRRLKETLKTIKTDYVLFLLDDFFLQRPADTETIAQCIKWLDENKNVGAFNFISIEQAKIEHQTYKNFCLMPLEMQYRVNAQACVWRKDILDKSILDIESPWEWEIFGNIRNSVLLKDVEIYALKYGVISPYNYNFIQYQKSSENNIVVESAIMRGKWDLKCIKKCFEENDINIDYSIRGIYKSPKRNFIKRILSFITRPIRKKSIEAKRKISESENQKKYKLLVQDPIEQFQKNGEIKNG